MTAKQSEHHAAKKTKKLGDCGPWNRARLSGLGDLRDTSSLIRHCGLKTA